VLEIERSDVVTELEKIDDLHHFVVCIAHVWSISIYAIEIQAPAIAEMKITERRENIHPKHLHTEQRRFRGGT
jgi:hypothetical protein